MLKRFIKEFFKCRHKNAVLYSNEGYCPDCGKYLKKSYYIVRCSCCDIKRSAKRNFGVIMPSDKFCTNCGESEYTIEKCDKLNIVDVNYAIEVKEEVEPNSIEEKTEIWVEGQNKQSQDEKKVNEVPLIGQVKYIGCG